VPIFPEGEIQVFMGSRVTIHRQIGLGLKRRIGF
jgi:hypothetical protein